MIIPHDQLVSYPPGVLYSCSLFSAKLTFFCFPEQSLLVPWGFGTENTVTLINGKWAFMH